MGVTLNVGLSGSGKTYLSRQEVMAFAMRNPVIVLDRMCEAKWKSAPPALAKYAKIVEGPVAKGIEYIKRGYRLVIVRSDEDPAAQLDAACKWAIRYKGLAGVVMPEAHDALPNAGKIPPNASIAVTKWRHKSVQLWLDTQRLALLWRTATEQASSLRLFAIVGDRDRAVIRSMWGRELEACVVEAARRFAPRDKGGDDEPGWHVEMGLVRMPPYQLTRGPA